MQLSQLFQNTPYASLLSGFVNSYVKPISFSIDADVFF
jgi:hypothetical protein